MTPPVVFRCALCQQQFESDRSDAEAREEAKQNFGVTDLEIDTTMVMFCTDCYQKLTAFHAALFNLVRNTVH